MGDEIRMRPIGFIRSDHTDPSKTPIQPVYAQGCRGRAEILPEFEGGLRDIEGFSHLWILFHLHRSGPARLLVTPFMDDTERGVFATRSPSRPNAIGMSLVRLVSREGNVLHLDGVDMLDGTPILDIKPHSGRLDLNEDVRSGWLEGIDDATARERGRSGFEPPGGSTGRKRGGP